VLPPALGTLLETLCDVPPKTPRALRQSVLNANVTEGDLLPWADFDHPATDSYGRRLVHRGPRHEVMIMSWAPGDVSAIHDHGQAAWGMVQVFGDAEHAVFTLRGGVLSTLTRVHLEPGDIVELDRTTIHQMGNPGRGRFLSLHIYMAQQDTQDITAGSRVFDTLRGETLHVDGGVFHRLDPAQIRRRRPGLAADARTELRDLTDRLSRARRCGDTETARAALERSRAQTLQQRLRDHAGR